MLCLLFLCLHVLHKQKQLLRNYSIDLCNGDRQTTITLFKHTASSHKTNWTSLTNSLALSCLLYGKEIHLMNILKGKCSWIRLHQIPINVNIIVSLFLFLYFVYIYFCSVCCCIFLYLFTIFYADVCCCIFVYFFTILMLSKVKAFLPS